MRTTGVITKAFRDTLPVMTGYIVLGLGFGIILSTRGYNALWALLMCIVIYSGTMQFVAIDLFTSGASLAATGMTSLMVSARHLFYGLSMIERYEKVSGLRKFYMIFALTDETYSLVCEADDEDYCFWVSLFNHIYWTSGSIMGALLGQILPFDFRGIDFALTALFVSICVEQWLNTSNHYSSITGFVVSVLCLVVFGAESFLIPSMILITATLLIMRERIESE
ncbi:MAG: AzlC family ABC transporter permease [Synergistaceae bacterium]|nr:AzlC family ABC transporter permease [Synergistaceae bacterium]